MATVDRIVEISITRKEQALITKNATKASIGGVSHVRADPDDRIGKLSEDQFIGQVGELAGHKWLFGTIRGYIENRKKRNADPFKGDLGSDVEGDRIDFKASRWRDPNGRALLDHHLLVRPAERHDDNKYVFIMVRWRPSLHKVTAYIIGWATDDMLPAAPESEDCSDFGGAYALSGHDLQDPETFPRKRG